MRRNCRLCLSALRGWTPAGVLRRTAAGACKSCAERSGRNPRPAQVEASPLASRYAAGRRPARSGMHVMAKSSEMECLARKNLRRARASKSNTKCAPAPRHREDAAARRRSASRPPRLASRKPGCWLSESVAVSPTPRGSKRIGLQPRAGIGGHAPWPPTQLQQTCIVPVTAPPVRSQQCRGCARLSVTPRGSATQPFSRRRFTRLRYWAARRRLARHRARLDARSVATHAVVNGQLFRSARSFGVLLSTASHR